MAFEADKSTVWKFGYVSNMDPEFMRVKKNLTPLDSRACVLTGFALSFPKGHGIDYVEPSFATLKRIPEGQVHGVCMRLSRADADALDTQESGYDVEVHPVKLYDGSELQVEVYTSRKALAPDFPEGCCSERYRDILVTGARVMRLAPEWIQKLESLPVYTPSPETLARRATLPPPSALPALGVAELRQRDGSDSAYPMCCCVLGYVFEVQPMMRVHAGRDITFRNVLHARGLNMDSNDDGGVSPFPRLSQLEPTALEYARRYCDRFHAKCAAGAPVAVLREFWAEQEVELEGVFHGNTLSQL